MDLAAALARVAALEAELSSTRDSLAATERVALVTLRALRSTGAAMPDGLWLRERDLDVFRGLRERVDEGQKESQGLGGGFTISFGRLVSSSRRSLSLQTPAEV